MRGSGLVWVAKRSSLGGLLIAGLALGGCAANRVEPDPIAEAQEEGAPVGLPVAADAATFYYSCTDGYDFVAQISEETAWVFLRGETLALPREVSASGAKYGDGEVALWTKGQEALLEEPGAIHRDCRNDPRQAIWANAKLNGVAFRALGNEPAWSLEIVTDSKIVLETDYGAKRYAFALPPAERDDDGVTVYRTQESGHDLSVALRGKLCQDTMSGEAFESQVTVVIDGRTLHGCGRALR